MRPDLRVVSGLNGHRAQHGVLIVLAHRGPGVGERECYQAQADALQLAGQRRQLGNGKRHSVLLSIVGRLVRRGLLEEELGVMQRRDQQTEQRTEHRQQWDYPVGVLRRECNPARYDLQQGRGSAVAEQRCLAYRQQTRPQMLEERRLEGEHVQQLVLLHRQLVGDEQMVAQSAQRLQQHGRIRVTVLDRR